MSHRFTHAIVRPPSSNFADGLTSVALGKPDFAVAIGQFARYCAALEGCGLTLIDLPEDPAHPDATFVEDAAVLSPGCNVITRPGAPSRAGETAAIREALTRLDMKTVAIEAPGTLDGGDICEAGDHFFIGVSQRTNWDGAQQLAAFLEKAGYSTSCIDIRAVPDILHLKSGIASLGDNRKVAIDSLARHHALKNHEIVAVASGEEYAANCVRVNDRVLIAAGFPRFEHTLMSLGYAAIALEMGEFQKMDGGLSCLSLRF
jgi:dimethylargininase